MSTSIWKILYALLILFHFRSNFGLVPSCRRPGRYKIYSESHCLMMTAPLLRRSTVILGETHLWASPSVSVLTRIYPGTDSPGIASRCF